MFVCSSHKRDFAPFAKKYIGITKANKMPKLNLFFNRKSHNTMACLRLIEENLQHFFSEGVDLPRMLRDMLTEQAAVDDKRTICGWVVANFATLDALFRGNSVFLEILKEEADFFADNISKLEFARDNVHLKIEILSAGESLDSLTQSADQRQFEQATCAG